MVPKIPIVLITYWDLGPTQKANGFTHCQKHVSPLAPITTLSSSHLGKLIEWEGGDTGQDEER